MFYFSCFRRPPTKTNKSQVRMSSWTAERSAILSLMLDEVSGTEEMVTTRQDFCRVADCIESCHQNTGMYYTGSRAEGLDLPGSDDDYMCDINDRYNIRVAQTAQEARVASSPRISTLLLCTDNVHPGFALLRWLSNSPLILHPLLLRASQNMYGFPHLSSFLFTRERLQAVTNLGDGGTRVIQGPSIETWSEYSDRSESGDDHVPSIHCAFWPRGAEEWLHRHRRCGWPTPTDITQITDFGCHLVAVGYPLSASKEMEWRISFSVAERILVWSFNHVQIQCYAVMKIILKEFIKVRCSPSNYVLCSYFIKTLLFWKFEVTESTFWRADNFRACISFLLVEFTKCIRNRELPHYFFPSFNLLSVKLTREAQRELLPILETAIEHDIAILRECNTLRKVWSRFTTTDGNINHVTRMMKKTNIVRNDKCLMYHADICYSRLTCPPSDLSRVTRAITHLTTGILDGRYTTSLAPLVLRYHVFMSNIPHRVPGNRDAYKLGRLVHSDAASFDISTCKLWYAMVLLMRTDYATCLRTVNDVLSRIPPFALYWSCGLLSSRESTSLYEHVYLQSDADVMERLRTSWLQDLYFYKHMLHNINFPLAVHIELSVCDELLGVPVSPFVFAYYLMFLCHHELHQYDDRDRVLRLLVDTVFNPEQRGLVYYHHSLNIAGHCLLLAGRTDRAREMFIMSYQSTQTHPPFHKYNSALLYLHSIPW